MINQTESSPFALLDSLGYAYFEADLSGGLTLANDTFCQALDYTPEEIVGRHYRHFLDARQIQRVTALFDAIHRTGQPQPGIEFSLKKRGGAPRFAEGTIGLIRNAAGEPIGFRGILHDSTERKQSEAASPHITHSAEHELEVGRRIQAGFLPDQLPQLPGWEIAARFQAAREVAGDFYDAFALSSGKRMGLVIADVCGKGVGAALFMALFRSLIRAFADQHYSLSWLDVLSDDASASRESSSVGRRRALLSTGTAALKSAIDLTNRYIVRNHRRDSMFATVFFGVLDPATGQLMYINAGHNPPLIIGPAGITAHLKPTGPAVGLMPGVEFGIEQVELARGDVLLAFTDGVPDARSPAGEFFAEERLLSLVQAPAASATALLELIYTAVRRHIAGADQFDDITMLALRRQPAP
ncbi:MAG TPA: SpoIIE family protein phosphatase [Anaerolineae bacterium]|nr:SpoIIE family protein phosphatase [Anaerolineae bacterium]